jgi:hypothetical protein
LSASPGEALTSILRVPVADEDPHFDRWKREDNPEANQVSYMEAWLNGLVEMPRREPSRGVAREHPHPQDELRGAWLIDAEAFVVYTLDADETPRILHVGRYPPEGVAFGF